MFRHTMATLMLEHGADIRYIQEMLGHARLDTTQIFTQVCICKLKVIHSATHPARMKLLAAKEESDTSELGTDNKPDVCDIPNNGIYSEQ